MMSRGAMKKLNDKLIGGIYEAYRIDNNETVYRGSTEHEEDKFGTPLEKVENFHRKGETFNLKYKYSWTVFRSNLRRSFGEKIKFRWVHEPKEMTRKKLLELERDSIQEKVDKGECYLNHTPDPLSSWMKYNG